MTMHDGLVLQSTRFAKRVAGRDLTQYKVVEPGQLVVSFPIDEGVLDFLVGEEPGIVSPAYRVWDLTSGNEVHRPFLKRYLRSPEALGYYQAKMRGSTARRRSMPQVDFLDMRVPLPAVEEQRRIAAILDHADSLRAKRRQTLAHLETLSGAIFAEMFGATTVSTRPLGAFTSLYSGGTPSKSDASLWSGTTPWFSAKDLKLPELFDSMDHISDDVPRRTSLRLLSKDTVVLGVRGMTLAHTIPVCVLKIPATINQDLKAVLPADETDVAFLSEAIRYRSPWLLARVTTSAHGTKKLDTAILQATPIPDVSTSMQREFSSRVRDIHRQLAHQRRSLVELDGLFASLQARAFSGRL